MANHIRTEEEVLVALRAIVTERLDIKSEDIQMTTRFEDVGADSLDVVDLAMAVEEAFDLSIDKKDYEKLQSVGDLVKLIVSRPLPSNA